MNDHELGELRTELEALRSSQRQSDSRVHEFVGRLAHELRTPLGAILMWAHVLRMGNERDRTAALDAIDASARAQSRMIGHLLDVTRGLAGRLKLDVRPLDLREPIGTAAEAMAPQARERSIRFDVSLASGAFPVEGDTPRLHDVIACLLDNAVKFTPEGGVVSLALVRQLDAGVIVVRDNGRGVAAEDLAHLFTPFRLVGDAKTRPTGGLGVSLALVRLVAQLHNGTVTAQSEGVGQGAEFRLQLPLTVPA